MDKIRIGDTVRFSYNTTPRIYLIVNNRCGIGITTQCVVEDIDDDTAVIHAQSDEEARLVIPTKYLIKVEADAKEPTAPAIKAGDNVRNIITGEVGRVLDIQKHVAKVDVVCDWKDRYWDLNNIEVFVPKAEECHYIPTEAEKKPNFGSITIPVKADLTDSYWDAYTADLAKEVVLKIAGSQLHNHQPQEISRMAVEIAKSVVENLKESEE